MLLYRRLIVFAFFILTANHVTGQDIVNFTQFFFNPYKTNPSYAGIDGKACLSLAYRKQWATIDGGPTISNLSFHAPTSKRLSYGINVSEDKRGLLSTSGFLLTVGYNIPVADQSSIRFGLSGGLSFNQIDLSRLDGFTDKAIANILNSNTYVSGNAGVSFHSKTFHGGVSLPLLLQPAYVSKDAFGITQVKPFQSVIVHVSNRFYFNSNKNVFEPYLLYRINQGLPSQFEAAAVVHLRHAVYVGGSYKQDFGFSALGGFKINNTLAIGASYGIKNTGVNELNSPTYELLIGYLFGKHRKENQTYSFVDTHVEKVKKGKGTSASEKIAEKRKQDELQKKKAQEALAQAAKNKVHKPSEVQKKQSSTLATTKPATTGKEKISTNLTPVENTVKKDSAVHKARFTRSNIGFDSEDFLPDTEHTPEDEQERLSRFSVLAKNSKETTTVDNYPNAERHDFVRKGNHSKELGVDSYVISGMFNDEADAKKFSSGLKKAGFSSGFGYLTENSVWCVYVFESKDIDDAKMERDRLRKFMMLRDSWVLTVHQ